MTAGWRVARRRAAHGRATHGRARGLPLPGCGDRAGHGSPRRTARRKVGSRPPSPAGPRGRTTIRGLTAVPAPGRPGRPGPLVPRSRPSSRAVRGRLCGLAGPARAWAGPAGPHVRAAPGRARLRRPAAPGRLRRLVRGWPGPARPGRPARSGAIGLLGRRGPAGPHTQTVPGRPAAALGPGRCREPGDLPGRWPAGPARSGRRGSRDRLRRWVAAGRPVAARRVWLGDGAAAAVLGGRVGLAAVAHLRRGPSGPGPGRARRRVA